MYHVHQFAHPSNFKIHAEIKKNDILYIHLFNNVPLGEIIESSNKRIPSGHDRERSAGVV